MKEKTLTDVLIELGLINDHSGSCTLDDRGAALTLDGKSKEPQKEEKSRE